MATELNTAVTTPTGLLGHDGSGPGTVTPTRARTLLNVENGATADQTAQEIATAIDADATAESTLQAALVTTAAVTAAGALMDSEVDADIKTLSLPASTTISAFGATLVDDADQATAQATLGVDPAGTDNSTDVTLAGTPDYITISGQVITRNAVDLAADVTGNLPVSNLNGGSGASGTTYWRGDGTWGTPTGEGGGIANVVEDTSPQLGGALDVNGQKIVSVSDGNIDIEPHGTGNVLLGNFEFDADQTVGAGQDDYVLRYSNSTGLISLEAESAGGSGTVTSVAVSGSDGIEIDSGSPITDSGTIALGINASTLRSTINVEDGADVTDATNVAAAGALMADGGVAVLIDSDPAAITHSSGGSAINLASVVTNSVRVTLTANSDGLTPPTADPASGNEREILVTLVQDGSGSHTVANLTADADVSLADGTIAPAVDTTAGAETSFVLKGNSAGAWLLYGDPTIRTAQIEDDAVTRAKIADAAMSGADATLITGTAGTNGNLVQWNADGDAVDSSIAAANVLVDADIGSAVQAWDAQLDTWAGVTPSANGQSLVAAADYAAMKGLLDLEIGTDVESFTSLSANQYAARNTGNSAKEARTDKRIMSVAFDVDTNGTYPLAMIGNFGITLSQVSGSCEGGTCDYQITKNGASINGFGSAISLTTSVTDTASTETLAEDDKLRVVITNASSLTGLYITFKGTRTGE